MAIQTQTGASNANVLGAGLPVVGGDQQGANLIIRSNSTPVKGAVIFDELTPSFGPNSGAIQTNGGVGVLNNVSVGGQFINMPNGYSVNNVMIPPGQGGDYRGYFGLVGCVSGTQSGTVVTVTFATQTVPPFYIGQTVTIAAAAPSVYNSPWVVTSCSTSTFTFTANASSVGTMTTLGYAYAVLGGGSTSPAITFQNNTNTQTLQNNINDIAYAVANTNVQTFVITAVATGTITFANGTGNIPPFIVGQYFLVSNVTPTGYNGWWLCTASTTTTVSATMGGSGATSFVAGAGTVSCGYVVGTSIINPGSGYTQPPQITFAEPTTTASSLWFANMQGQLAPAAIPQTITLNGFTTIGAVSTVVTPSITNINGQTVTVSSSSTLYPGQPVLISGLTAGQSATTGMYNQLYYVVGYPGAGTTVNLAINPTNALWGITITFTGGSQTVSATLTSQITQTMSNGFAYFGWSAIGSGTPFFPGQLINISGTSANGNIPNFYNQTWQVYYATNTQVWIQTTYTQSLSANQGTITTQGTNVPQMFIRAPQTGSPYAIYYYQVTYPGYLSSTVPSHTYGFQLNGSAGLLYVGQVAQGYPVLGYSGIITQGAVHQVGCVVNIVITNAGSGYTGVSAPVVLLSRPDVPGGRQAQAICTVSSGAITTIQVTDQGSGYLNPPSVTFISAGSTGTGATAVAVIGNPGEKPIVSSMPIATIPANTYVLDFGLTGHNVVFLNTGTNSTVYFDNLANSGGTPYSKGFPLGRRVIMYVKNTSGSSITITFSNLLSANAGSTGNAPVITANHILKAEFIVLSQGNSFNQSGASYAGGSVNDVYATFTLT
jgi:hypothetical protein